MLFIINVCLMWYLYYLHVVFKAVCINVFQYSEIESEGIQKESLNFQSGGGYWRHPVQG